MSYAVKYAILKTFTLETGENDESRMAEPYTSEQFEVYHELVSTEKAYEFYLFTAALPAETLNALYNSFPDGKISKGKKLVSKLDEDGRAAFAGVVEDVQTRLAAQDISVIEITDEMDPMEKRLLAARLSDFEVAQLKRIKEAAE